MFKTLLRTNRADQLITDMASCIDFSAVRDQIASVFAFSYLHHCISSQSTWRQALILSHPVVDSDQSESPRIGQEAKIFLELANGIIYGFKLTGNVQCGIDQLSEIAEALNQQRYDVDGFPAIEASLTCMLNGSLDDSSRHCAIHLFNNAPFAPAPSFLISAINRISIALLSSAQEKYHPDKVGILQSTINAYFPDITQGQTLLTLFTNNLNQTTTELLTRLSKQQGQDFSCLNSYNYLIAGDAVLHRNRCQAILELPWLFPFLARPYLAKWKFSALSALGEPEVFRQTPEPTGRLMSWQQMIAEVIDQGLPLFSKLAEIFVVPRETIKGTRQQMLSTSRMITLHDIDLLLSLLSCLAPEKRPRSAQAWEQFEAVVQKLVKFIEPFMVLNAYPSDASSRNLNIIKLLKNPDVMRFVATSLNELQGMKLDLPLAKRWCELSLSPAADLLTALHAAVKEQQLPCPDLSHSSVENARRFMLNYLRSQTLTQIVRVSTAWHARIIVEADGLIMQRGVDVIAEWPLVLTTPFETRDRIVKELHNESALIHEGRLMGHCIGSYGRCCSRGTSAIFSISDHQKRRRSTLELKIEATGFDVVESYHCGFKNSKPGVFELTAAKELIEYLNSSALADAVRERGQFQQQKAIHHREVTDLRNQRQKEYVLMTQRVAWDCYLDAGNIA